MQPLIYNVTTAVCHAAHTGWLAWMQDIHIPEVLGTGCFYKHQLVRILETDESEGLTYAVQYFTENSAVYETYLSSYAYALKKSVADKWGEQVFSFSTLMAILP